MEKKQSAVTCECGHDIDSHSSGGCGCMYAHFQENLDGPPMCDCVQSPSVIAATLSADNAELRRAVGELVDRWRNIVEANEKPTDRIIGYSNCAEELARLLAPAAAIAGEEGGGR